jgi:hypothetical protein
VVVLVGGGVVVLVGGGVVVFMTVVVAGDLLQPIRTRLNIKIIASARNVTFFILSFHSLR